MVVAVGVVGAVGVRVVGMVGFVVLFVHCVCGCWCCGSGWG